MYKKQIAIFFIGFSLYANAQQQAEDVKSNSINDQFEQLKDQSNNYQQYKVVKKLSLNKLQQNTLDSINNLKSKVDTLNRTISEKEYKITSLQDSLSKTEEDLAFSREKEDGIEIFGILTKKAVYNTILWSTIAVLIIALLFFIYKFKSSNKFTKQSQKKLAETEIEFETYKQKKLEEIQKLRRKLQDEINKNRGV